jgi:bacterioferritin
MNPIKTESKQVKIYDIDKIKTQARQSIQEGAVTESYPLDLTEACRLLNEALATEILCVLRYRHHQIIAKGINYIDVAAEFAEHAEEEEKHMLMLAERINQLGGDPDFSPTAIIDRAVTDYGVTEGANLKKLIEDDLVAERVVIDVYRKLIQWFGTADSTTRRLLEKILEDEEQHADDLADLLIAPTRH